MHLRDRERVISDLIKALRPGGWLLLEEAEAGVLDALPAGSYIDAWRVLIERKSLLSVLWNRSTFPVVVGDRGAVSR